jgi:benzil reductase ((S)-benzoin forming)
LKSLIIITGTTKGLGSALESMLLINKNNHVLTVNRVDRLKDADNYTNLNIDLSVMDETDNKKFRGVIIALMQSNTFDKVVFINNAFTISPLASIHDMNNADIIHSCHTNIVSAILLLKAFISITHDIQVEKNIVNISSGAARYPIDKWSIYCLSKASIEMFMQSITKEYGENFNVYSIDPGTIDTTMQETIRKNIPENEYFLNLKNKNLLKKPKDIAMQILEKVGL